MKKLRPLCLLSAVFTATLLTGCGSSNSDFVVTGTAPNPQPGVLAQSTDLHFAHLSGVLSDAEPSHTHQIRIDPAQFTLPNGRALLKFTLEHEHDQTVQLADLNGFERVGDGLLGPAAAGSTLTLRVTGRGAYRVLVSLAGDVDGDGDVDGTDLTRLQGSLTSSGLTLEVADLNGDGELDAEDHELARENAGTSTRVRPLQMRLGLHHGLEPLAAIGETLDETATFAGQASPGASVNLVGGVLAQALPLLVDSNGEFTFEAPLVQGENTVQAVATDSFGQRVDSVAVVERVEQPSEAPTRMDQDRRNRIWLLDEHNNNFLFRGPLPLNSLEDDGRVDFTTLIDVMNQRLAQQGASISTLPPEFKFTEITLITNRVDSLSKSHGDEGFATRLIYSTILSAIPGLPPDDTENPTSLYTGPLDNKVVEGPTLTQTVQSTTYTVHPGVTWQPTAANSTGQAPTTLEGGSNGYEAVVKSTFPIVSIASNPEAPQRQLSNPLSNVSVVTRYVHGLMSEDNTGDVPHIYYLHCINGHDRTGMVATAYVLSAYGASFDYDLATAYKYGQMSQYLPGTAPDGVDPNRNYWDELEQETPKSGELKKKYMQAVQALAYLYHHPAGSGVQKAPAMATKVPEVPLWKAGYRYGDPASSPTEQTPADYVHVRP